MQKIVSNVRWCLRAKTLLILVLSRALQIVSTVLSAKFCMARISEMKDGGIHVLHVTLMIQLTCDRHAIQWIHVHYGKNCRMVRRKGLRCVINTHSKEIIPQPSKLLKQSNVNIVWMKVIISYYVVVSKMTLLPIVQLWKKVHPIWIHRKACPTLSTICVWS